MLSLIGIHICNMIISKQSNLSTCTGRTYSPPSKTDGSAAANRFPHGFNRQLFYLQRALFTSSKDHFILYRAYGSILQQNGQSGTVQVFREGICALKAVSPIYGFHLCLGSSDSDAVAGHHTVIRKPDAVHIVFAIHRIGGKVKAAVIVGFIHAVKGAAGLRRIAFWFSQCIDDSRGFCTNRNLDAVVCKREVLLPRTGIVGFASRKAEQHHCRQQN